MNLDVRPTVHPGLAVVSARGELDLAGAPELRTALSDHLSEGNGYVLLDLTAVTFIDSTGLGIVVGAGKRAQALGGCLRIVCDNTRVLRLLALTGITKTLGVFPTFDEAVADWPPES